MKTMNTFAPESGSFSPRRRIAAVLLGSFVTIAATSAVAQTVRVGLVTSSSGPFASLGDQIDKAVKLYTKQHADSLPPGVKIEIISRDDSGPNPDTAKRLTQELIVRDKVNFLTGFIWTPNAMAAAPLITESKTPLVIMNAAASVITTRSPYFVRMSFTLWQPAYQVGIWAARKYKRAYTMVSDFAPGHDAEAAFVKGFTDNGGQLVGQVRMPLANPDFVAYMQRAKDMKPEVIFNMVSAGVTSTRLMKAYGDLELRKAGIPFVGTGDAVTEEELVNMGDAPLGYISAMHYSMVGDRPANKAFVAAWEREYGRAVPPGFIAVGAYDAMDAIYTAVREQKGKVDPDVSMKILAGYRNADSPRGPIAIDPATRDIVQNIYIRETRRVGDRLANVELETIPAVKDPWKEFNSK
jgi:branched-chain amino acid transport system substrate-binding protein